MRRHPVGRALLTASAAMLVACAGPSEPTDAGAARLTASGVTIEVAAGDDTLRARGDHLELSGDGREVVLRGDARVEVDGRSRLEARAERLRLVAGGPVVELRGRVRATFALDGEEAVDANL